MESAIQVFRYEKPAAERGKTNVKLASTDVVRAGIQYVREGGETNLHSHSGNDGFWLVLRGRARFYGEGAEPVAELGPEEGAMVPHGTPYWFEAAGDEPLEILHVASKIGVEDRRTDHAPPPPRRQRDRS